MVRKLRPTPGGSLVRVSERWAAAIEAELALKMEEIFKARAKENIKAGGQAGGKGPQNSAEALQPMETREEIAKLAGVSHDTIDKVKKIQRNAVPELMQAARTGEVSIRAAAAKPFAEEAGK